MHAILWHGSAATWVDLGAMLPEEFARSSRARGVWSNATTTRVVGWAFNSVTLRDEAILWEQTRCGADFDENGFVTANDFDAYVLAFVAGGSTADFDGNGFVTGDDYDAFVAAFSAGC